MDVRFEEVRHDLAPGESLTIGRQADLIVDPENRRLHRTLVHLGWSDGWFVANVGKSITVVITDLDGVSYARLAPGESLPLPFNNSALSFSAGSANYRLTLHTDSPGFVDPDYLADDGVTADRTENPAALQFNSEQLELLTALAEPRLSGPISVSDLPSSRQLALSLGWSLSKLNRKLDHLCAKLDRAGVRGVTGPSGATASERRLVLANFAVESGIVAIDGGNLH